MLPALEFFAKYAPTLSGVRLILAHAYAERGHLENARGKAIVYEQVLDELPQDDTWIAQASLCAELCAALGDEREAELLLERLGPFETRGVVYASQVGGRGSLARSLGLFAASIQRLDQVDRLFDEAMGYCSSLATPTLRAWTLINHPRVALARRGRGRSGPACACADCTRDRRRDRSRRCACASSGAHRGGPNPAHEIYARVGRSKVLAAARACSERCIDRERLGRETRLS